MWVSDSEMEMLAEARRIGDWRDLPTDKLRYLYQRYVALPGGRTHQVIEIANLAAKKLGKSWRGETRLPPEEEPKKKTVSESGDVLPF